MFDRFVPRKVLRDAIAEATLRGDQRAGTEHVLVALLQQPLPFDRSLLGALGAPVETLRAALDDMDRAALAAVGVDITEHVGRDGDIPAGEWPIRRRPTSITQGTRDVMAGASRAAAQRRHGLGRRITIEHLLLELTALPSHDPAIRLMRELGSDPMEVRAVVLSELRKAA